MTDPPLFTIRSAEKSSAMAACTELPMTIGINQHITHPIGEGNPRSSMGSFYRIDPEGFKPSFVAEK
jgi:hypothetical protein